MREARTLAEFLNGVIGVVEANSFESLCLWQETHQIRGVAWGSGLSGPLITVGHVAERPICVSLFVNMVAGFRVLFMHPTSDLVDHSMIDDWLRKNLPGSAYKDGGKYINKTDAMNFITLFPHGALTGSAAQ